MVGEGSPGAELHPGEQLHRAGEGVVRLRVLLDPLHQVHRVRVVELPQVLEQTTFVWGLFNSELFTSISLSMMGF